MGRNYEKVIARKRKAKQRQVCQSKVAYDDWETARSAALGHPYRVRPYPCSICSKYHLSSKA